MPADAARLRDAFRFRFSRFRDFLRRRLITRYLLLEVLPLLGCFFFFFSELFRQIFFADAMPAFDADDLRHCCPLDLAGFDAD